MKFYIIASMPVTINTVGNVRILRVKNAVVICIYPQNSVVIASSIYNIVVGFVDPKNGTKKGWEIMDGERKWD